MGLPKRYLPQDGLQAHSFQVAFLPLQLEYIRKEKHWPGVCLAVLHLLDG